MKAVKFLVLFGIFTCFIQASCNRGCMDPKSLAYDPDATKDNGSCQYSRVTFYAKYGYYNGIPITQINISVKGNSIGNLNAVYPNGPGNCAAAGTVAYQFEDSKSADWTSTVVLANGATLYGSGSVSPNRYDECIKVNVTQ